MDKLLLELQISIKNGQTQFAMDKTKELLKNGVGINEIIETATKPAFKELGIKMHNGEVYITDVLMSSRAMLAAMYVMEPILSKYRGPSKGLVAIGTVGGDLHDIGKNLVAMMLKNNGYTVIDLGIDVTKEVFMDAVKKYNPDVLALSSLLTTTMPELDSVIKMLNEQGLRPQVRVIVGGAPVNAKYAASIGSDAYASDLFEAVEAIDDLINDRIGKYSL